MKAVDFRWRFALGFFGMFYALVFHNVTLASEQYSVVLVIAAVLAIGADLYLASVVRHGTPGWKIAAVVTMLPTLFILADSTLRLSRVR